MSMKTMKVINEPWKQNAFDSMKDIMGSVSLTYWSPNSCRDGEIPGL